jgi:DMSO/TMAO reductase YedYZ molybdopterin-dependent catalytic subunit
LVPTPTTPTAPRGRSRRELLKMAPLLGAGVLLLPSGRQAVIEGGLALSDRAAAASFRTSLLAPTFSDTDVTPLDRFPLNSYLAHDPELNLDRWRLLVEGLVSRPGEYTIDKGWCRGQGNTRSMRSGSCRS